MIEIQRIRLARHVWSLAACVVTLLTGAWLMLAPFALGYQSYGASWTTATRNQFWLGLGVVLLSVLGLALFVAALVAELRAAGVEPSAAARMQRPPAGAEHAVAPAQPRQPQASGPVRSYPQPSYPPQPAMPAQASPPQAYSPQPQAPQPMAAQPQPRAVYPQPQPVLPEQSYYAQQGQPQTADGVSPQSSAQARPPAPSQPAQPSPSGAANEQFERAVLMLAHSLAEDLAERRARAAHEEQPSQAQTMEGAGTR